MSAAGGIADTVAGAAGGEASRAPQLLQKLALGAAGSPQPGQKRTGRGKEVVSLIECSGFRSAVETRPDRTSAWKPPSGGKRHAARFGCRADRFV
jgi:hypothetical protein